MLETTVVDIPSIDGGNEVWIEALPARIFHTPQYGAVEVSQDKLKRMIKNFNDGVRGQEVATDFDHGMDRAKGNQASGWYREFAIKPSSDDPTQASLYARVELTDDALNEVKQSKWKYFSLEWDDAWTDNDGTTHSDVIMGGALTNRPIAKKIMPINFSEALWDELDYETKKEFAVWSTKFINDLPDSCFLYVEPGGQKDGDGKTVPRSKRHFPYKSTSGIDLPHLRNAIARIPQSGAWLSESMKSSLQSRARKLLGATNKAMAEDNTALLEAIHVMDEAGLEITDESKEWEHSEPGRGNPPTPRTDEDGSDDPSVQEGWRRPTPPNQDAPPPQRSGEATTVMEGGILTPEQEFELRRILDIDADGDVIQAAKLQLGELTELKRTVDAASQERKFSEEYPDYWREHNKLMGRDRENSARAFSESVQRVRKAEGFGLRETQKGLSSMSLTKVKDLHVKFSEGTATLEDFEDCIRTITNGGIVEFGEIGTSVNSDDLPIIDTSSAPGIAGARKLFGEVLSKIQADNPDMDFRTAFAEAAKKHPDLAEAYSVALPG